MSRRLLSLVATVLLVGACGLGGSSGDEHYRSARAALVKAGSAQVLVNLSFRVLPGAARDTGQPTSVGFQGWVRGPRASGTSSIRGLPSQVVRDNDRLYTYVTPQYLAVSVGSRANPALANHWLVSDAGAAAALSGAMTWPEVLRLLPADVGTKDRGTDLLDGREARRLEYETDAGTEVTLWVSRTAPVVPLQLQAESGGTHSKVSIRFARLGGAPRVELPRDVVDPFRVLH